MKPIIFLRITIAIQLILIMIRAMGIIQWQWHLVMLPVIIGFILFLLLVIISVVFNGTHTNNMYEHDQWRKNERTTTHRDKLKEQLNKNHKP